MSEMSGGAETRARILTAARRCFGERGYDRTTNRDIARLAGITAGGIYHYFDSKQDVYVAASEEVRETLIQAFRTALDAAPTLREKLRALLRAAGSMHQSDASLAMFLSTSPVEMRRHPDLALALQESNRQWFDFFHDIVADAAASGELEPGIETVPVATMLAAVTTGLAQSAADQARPADHLATLEAFERLVFDRLFAPIQLPVTQPAG